MWKYTGFVTIDVDGSPVITIAGDLSWFINDNDKIYFSSCRNHLRNLGSFEKLILDEEVVYMLQRSHKDVTILDKKGSVDLMVEVSPRRNHLKGRISQNYREEHYVKKYGAENERI